MRTSETVGAIGGALAKAQGVMEGATKDSTNPHFRSKYADLAAVVGACRSALAQQEIGVVQSPSTGDGAVVRMVTTLLHSSGEWIESDPLTVQAKDAGPQSVGSCLTYLRRYQLAALVGVAPEDDDAEAAEGRTPNRAAQAVAPAPAGYAEWLTDLSAVVDNGMDVLKATWRDSPEAFRQYLMTTNLGGWEGMKAAAQKKTDAAKAAKTGPKAIAS
jgi:hypothetical protein